MGLTPDAWTPNKTGQDLRKQDETRAGASARRVGCCCSDGAPHGFCFALLAMATRRPSRNPDRAPGSTCGGALPQRRTQGDIQRTNYFVGNSAVEGIHRDSIVRTRNDNFVVTLNHRRRIRIRAPRRYKRRPAGARRMAIPRKEQG